MNREEPFIEMPETRHVNDTDLFCFSDATRPCNSSCVAYLLVQPEGDDYKEQPWAQCLLLVNAHRSGKHLTVLASVASSACKSLHIKIADDTRKANSGGL